MSEQSSQADRIDRELLLPARCPEVWEVITGDGWLADEVELDPLPGGEARFITAGSIRTGWVEELRPPGGSAGARLVFWWGEEGAPASRVEISLEPGESETTLLRVSETRPLEVLDVAGVPLPGSGGASPGPSLLVAAAG